MGKDKKVVVSSSLKNKHKPSFTNTKKPKIISTEQLKLTETITNNASACLFMIDHNGIVIFMNPAAKKITGYTVKDAIGKPMHLLVHHSYPDGSLYPESACPLVETYKNGKLNPLHEEIFFRKNGTPFPAMVSGTPILGANSVRGTVIEFIDITQLKQSQKALIASEKQFRTMADAVPVMIWITDQTGYCIYLNKQWYDYTGQLEKKALGYGWLSAVHPDDEKISHDIFIDSNTKQKPFSIEYRLRKKDTSYRWHLDSALPKFDHKGDFEGFIGSVIDIHERKLAEDSLKESESRLRFMSDSMPQQVWTAQPDGSLDYVNDYAVKYFNKSAEEVIGEGWQNVIHPEDLKECITLWTHSLKTGNPYQVFFRLRRSDGAYRWHLGRALSLKNKEKILKWFGTNTDIDDQKKLERQKDDFLGIASHELKTPVTSIKAYGQALEIMFRRKGDIKAADRLKKLDGQVDKLNNLIADLLDVTKMQSGKMQFHKSHFDFNVLVNEVIEETQRITQTHQIISELSKTKQLYGDRERIGQVLTNLITNAIKYSPNATNIIITTSSDKKSITLCVKDFGVGVPKEKLDNVFEQFFRVSGPKQDTFPGLGLGLYIASEIVKREGGKIWVESAMGKGSTFCFSIPCTKNKKTAHD